MNRVISKLSQIRRSGAAAAPWYLQPQNIFLALGVSFGLLFALITPPFQVPDEPRHFLRAYQVSELHLVGFKQGALAGGNVPTSIAQFADTYSITPMGQDTIVRTWRKHTTYAQPDKQIFADLSNTVIYSPVNYLPQAIGIGIGRLFDASPLTLLLLARLAALAAWLAMVYFAIRIAPTGKWLIMVFSLLPMVVFEAASTSADSTTYGVAALATAAFIAFIKHKKPTYSAKGLWPLVLLALALGLVKTPYALLSLVLLVPVVSRSYPRNKRIVSAALIALAFLGTLIWTALTQVAYVVPSTVPTAVPAGVDFAAQLKLVLYHPFGYILTLLNTTFSNYSNIVVQGMMGLFGWLTLPLYSWAVALGYAYFGALAVGKREAVMGRRERLWFLGIIAMSILAILTILYLTWTPVGARLVFGVQTRYFFPLLPLLAITLGDQLNIPTHRKYIYIGLTVTLLLAATELFLSSYYSPLLLLR